MSGYKNSRLEGQTPLQTKRRKRIEECFGWFGTTALLRKVRHRGCASAFDFTLACAAYNLVRMRNLAAAIPAVLVRAGSVSCKAQVPIWRPQATANTLSDNIIHYK
jgi:Transposase DDE domain